PIFHVNLIQDTVAPLNEDPEDDKTDGFYDSLRIRASKKKWTRQIHDIVILNPRKKLPDTLTTQRTDFKYLDYAGLKIRNIDFLRLDPFGSSITDTSFQSDNWINRAGNTFHIKTQERILRRNLVIQENDAIDPNKLADNERIIRDLPYINDVRIIVTPDPDDPGYADILFIVKDLWSKAFFPEFKDIDAGKLEMWDRNIFGIGNEFQNNIHWDPSKSDFWGYEAFFKNKNILGSFIDSRVYYQNIFDTESYGLDLSRKFLTPETKYAGGAQVYKMKTIRNIWVNDSIKALRPLKFNYTDLWLGRSFSLKNSRLSNSKRLNLIIASRFISEHYFERPPEVESRFLHEYHSKTLWLNSLALSAQNFYNSNLIYSYGRTEDIPNGWLVNATFGKEFSEFDDRVYTSLELRHGDYIGSLGYFYAASAVGGFINDKNCFEQGLLRFNLNYFTNLFILGQFKFRYFSYLEYLNGLNRFPLERVNINDRNGIRGLSVNEIFGQQKITLNIESVIFSPFSPYGFNFVFFGFADLALIGKENIPLNKMDFYSGIGFGARIRNERLVFPTFQFRFSFYPTIKNLPLEDYFRFSGEKKLNPENFSTSSPSTLPYL
ncbi:MAG: hypothetical protein IH594_12105, partial [Bacteroidales bacterium]|nr:hypothetical protein [Bacteroidales bacterium]